MAFHRAARTTLVLLVAIGCFPPDQRGAPTLAVLPSPAGVSSGEPYLYVDASDRLHMTWIEKTSDSTHAVRYARLDGDSWSAPSTVVERGDLFVNWADFPAVIATPGGRLLAHWLQRSGGGKYAYDVRVAQSIDGGATWTDGMLLHRDGKPAEHGFVALWQAGGDSVAAAWLDGRNMTAGDHGEGAGAMTVHSTTVAPDASLGSESMLDARNCECCQVNAAVASAGPVVVYRDRSDDDVRDIAIVRQVNGAWTPPATVYPDGWKINACPVNGPAVDARGDTVVVAWFTGARDTARVRAAFSVDGGASFTAPVGVDGGAPVGRVDVELLDDGSAAVSWLERVPPEGGEVRMRRIAPTGPAGPAVTLAATSAARPAGFPKVVRRGTDLIAAWTVPGDSAHIRLGRLAIRDLP